MLPSKIKKINLRQCKIEFFDLSSMNFIDLFCGCGGLSEGFIQENYKMKAALANASPPPEPIK